MPPRSSRSATGWPRCCATDIQEWGPSDWVGDMESEQRERSDMAEQLRGKTIAFLVANEGVEQVELTRPWDAVREAGAKTELIAPDSGEVQAFNHLDKADTF